MFFSEPVHLSCQPPPMPLRRLLLDFVESQRLASALFDGAMEAGCVPEWWLFGRMVTMKLYGALFQELIGDALPTIPDSVFAAVRSFPGLWPMTHPKAEGAALAARLAWRSIKKAIRTAEEIGVDDVLDALLWGAHDAADTDGLLVGNLPGFTKADEDEVLDILLAGGTLPEPFSLAYVQDAEAFWEKKWPGSFTDHFGAMEDVE